MDTEREKLSAVLNSPDADGPRLDYAAWCDRQEDPPTQARGTLIRVQLALASLGTGTGSSEEYPLRYQAKRLVAAHGSFWARNVTGVADRYEFDRGFVELVALSAEQFLEHANRLLSLAPIRHLDLTGVAPLAAKLFDSPHLRKIRSLGLDRCNLTSREVKLLAASPCLCQLRWLSLAENRIDMEGAEVLARSTSLPHLAYVNFFRNIVEPNEQYSYDNGFVVDAWLPEDGLRLERDHGPLPWLHHDARSIEDSIPNRFRIKSGVRPANYSRF